MAYNESTIGGSSGSQYRVWVNSIRVYDGSPTENFEDWRCEGGINRVVSGSRHYNNYGQATYTVQLGINGMAASGNYNYDFGGGTGGMKAWGTGTTRAYRNSAGVGFGFQSRTDVNLANSPFLTSGWVTSNDSVQTRYRHASLTAISMDSGGIPATDEGPMWLEFSNPAGASVDAFLEAPNGSNRIYTSASGISSRFNFPFTQSLIDEFQQASPNSNSYTVRIGVHDSLGGESYDFRDRTYTIKNDVGQANPTFADFDYIDENSTTVAVTGNNQVLIQGKSDLKVTVPVADKATANKFATMSNYNFTIGSYSQNSTWSNTVDVVHDVGLVSDVSGSQNLSVRAVDSRGNSKTVTKNVTVLPYASPGFYNNLKVSYANDFDIDDGLTVNLLNDEVIGSISPMTLGGTDINTVPSPSGLRFDVAKGTGSYSGTWTNIAFTQEAGTGYIIVDPVALATAIEGKINGMTEDNTVRWHILFEITDELETQYFTATIDVGRPFFRIGADGRLYYKEIEFFETFSGKSDFYYPSLQAYGTTGATWTRTAAAGYTGGWGLLYNPGGADGDTWEMDVYMPAGVYDISFYFFGSTTTVKVDININGLTYINDYDTYNAGGNIEKIVTLSNVGVLDGATYTISGVTNGRNAGNTTNWINGLLGIKARRIGDL